MMFFEVLVASSSKRTVPDTPMGLPYMPISWGGLRGQWGGIYGSPISRVWDLLAVLRFCSGMGFMSGAPETSHRFGVLGPWCACFASSGCWDSDQKRAALAPCADVAVFGIKHS